MSENLVCPQTNAIYKVETYDISWNFTGTPLKHMSKIEELFHRIWPDPVRSKLVAST